MTHLKWTALLAAGLALGAVPARVLAEDGEVEDGTEQDSGGGGSGGGTDTGTITMTASPSVLSDADLARLQRLARERIAGTDGGSAKPLAGIAIVLLALVFGPLFVRMRSGRS